MGKIYAIKLWYDGDSKIVHRFLYKENRDMKFNEIVEREKEYEKQGKVVKLKIKDDEISGRDVPSGYSPDNLDWTFYKVDLDLDD